MIKMEDKNVIAGLERTYRTMNPAQYVREIYQNSVEAGAQNVRFTYDKLAQRTNGIYKAIGLDDGPGIPKDKILELINNKNSSSKKVGGEEDNFGVGLKVSALPRNQHGLIVLCQTKEHPRGFMIWMAYDQSEDGEKSAGVKGLTSDECWRSHLDEDAELFIDHIVDFQEVIDRQYGSYVVDGVDWLKWWSVNRLNKKHLTGTAVIMLGNHPQENTVEHLQTKGAAFLRSRYLTFNNVQPSLPLADRRDHIEGQVSTYRMFDPIQMLLKKTVQSWQLKHKEWALLVFLKNTEKNQGVYSLTPLTYQRFIEATVYKNELYGDFDTITPQSRAALSRSWGLWSKKVSKRITLLIQPPAYTTEAKCGVYPNEARSTLSWKDSEEAQPTTTLPMDELKAFFQKNMPEEIKDLLLEVAVEDLTNITKSKSAEDYDKWLKIPKDGRKIKAGNGLLISHSSGDQLGGDSINDLFNPKTSQESVDSDLNPPKPPKPPKPPLTKEELEQKEAKRKARQAQEAKRKESPTVRFIRQTHEDAEGRFKLNGIWQAAFYQPPSASGEQGNILWVNKDHDLFRGYITAAYDELVKRKTPMPETAIVEHVVKPFWEEYAPCAIQHAKGLPSSKKDKDTFSPERLTWLFLGSVHFLFPKLHKYYKKYSRLEDVIAG